MGMYTCPVHGVHVGPTCPLSHVTTLGFCEAMIPPGSLIIDFAVPHVSEVWPTGSGRKPKRWDRTWEWLKCVCGDVLDA